MALGDRLSKLPQTQNRKALVDLPPQTQIDGINQVLAGGTTRVPELDSFIKSSAAKGMNPEQIRQAFIAQQRSSATPFLIVGG